MKGHAATCFVLALMACGPRGSGEQAAPAAVVLTRIDRGAKPFGSVTGYDAALPGYRFTGGIARVTLTAAAPPAQFVLALRVSTGTPHLDSFTFESPAGTIQWSPFAGPGLMTVTAPDGNRQALEQKDKYLRHEIVGDEIRVVFGPGALAMFHGECKISWIDWYR